MITRIAGGRFKPSFLRFGVGILIVLTAVFVAWLVARSVDYEVNNDFFTFWLGGRMLLQGQNPYDAEAWATNHTLYGSTWIENPVYIYPLPLAFLYVPLGILSLPVAAVVQIGLSILALISAAGLALSDWRSTKAAGYLPVILIGLFLYRPAIVTLRNGQLGGFLLFSLAMTAFLWERNRWFTGGGLMGFTLLKPTLGLPIAGLALIWLASNRKWNAILGFISVSVGLIFTGLLVDPGWINKFLQMGLQKGMGVFGYNPTLWGLANLACARQTVCSFVVGGAITVILSLSSAIILIRFRNRLDAWRTLALIVTVAIMMTPYLWAYDQIPLALPVWAMIGFLVRRDTPFILVANLYLAFSILSLGLLGLAVFLGHDIWSVVLPISVLIWLLWENRIEFQLHSRRTEFTISPK